ncbi:hypothetical protein [Lysobacter sp. D1-1-M9]|uniref:hypothetical protein n=1 Tax=Novilysobacter longmucuonensis TaxID=3098603 RepID=UPI002FC9E600
MKKTSVIDLLGVLRTVGYAIALLAAAVAVGVWLLGMQWPVARLFAAALAPWVLSGLMLAWVGGVSRWFVRRMSFESPQE